MIVIIGASGGAGIPIIKQLVARGHDVRALTSSESSQENLKSLGVAETVLGDFRKPDDLARVMAGAAQVVQIPARHLPDEFNIGKLCVDAAVAQGVGHYLFLSAYHPQMQDLPHHWSKLLIEEYLISSGLPFTVVQPSMFMQNLKVEWPRVVAEGIYARPYSADSKMSVIDTDDLGEAVVNILERPELRGAIYQLCGPGPITHNEMAAIISDVLGHKVEAVLRDIAEWRVWASECGWSEFGMDAYVAMCAHYDAHGYPGGNIVTLQAILGRTPGDYRAFIKKFIARQGA